MLIGRLHHHQDILLAKSVTFGFHFNYPRQVLASTEIQPAFNKINLQLTNCALRNCEITLTIHTSSYTKDQSKTGPVRKLLKNLRANK